MGLSLSRGAMLVLQHVAGARGGVPYERVVFYRPDVMLTTDIALSALPPSPGLDNKSCLVYVNSFEQARATHLRRAAPHVRQAAQCAVHYCRRTRATCTSSFPSRRPTRSVPSPGCLSWQCSSASPSRHTFG